MKSDPAIYEIRHVASGKVYVGSTNNWKRRQNEHRAELRGNRHSNSHLQRAWAKYGEESFASTTLESITDISCIVEREQHWIDALNSSVGGFNMCPAAGTTRGLPCSEEKKLKISAANSGRVYTETAKARIRAARANQTITPESAAKTRAKNLGQKRDAAFRARISEAQKGRPKSEATRAKLAAANTGNKASEATKSKMAASAKARWEAQRSSA